MSQTPLDTDYADYTDKNGFLKDLSVRFSEICQTCTEPVEVSVYWPLRN